jgi:hypothetical protein
MILKVKLSYHFNKQPPPPLLADSILLDNPEGGEGGAVEAAQRVFCAF